MKQTLNNRCNKTGISQVLQTNHPHGNRLVVFGPFCLGEIVHDGIVDMTVGGSACPRGIGNVIMIVGSGRSICNSSTGSIVPPGIDSKDTSAEKAIVVALAGRRRSFRMILMRAISFVSGVVSIGVVFWFPSIHSTGRQRVVLAVGMTLIMCQYRQIGG